MTPEQFPDELLYEGRAFPAEAEWLNLPMAELAISSDFVERTVRAVREQAETAAAEARLERELPVESMRMFVPPEPSADFVARTMGLLRQDRRTRWRELLARHVAPEPSPEFVARTLLALAADRVAGAPRAMAQSTGRATMHSDTTGRESAGRRLAARHWAWPLLAAAAVTLFWIATRGVTDAPLELRFAQNEPATFAYTYAATPWPAVLATLANSTDPYALPTGEADGVWLMLAR